MSHHRWELFSLGSIPHEVLSILLGSLPKVPDPKQEEEALERQYSTHDDRLSDDEDEEARRLSPLIHDPNSNHRRIANHDESSSLGNTKESKGNGEEISQRPWNVPDEEWEWSDEESSLSMSNSRTMQPSISTSATASRHGASLKAPSTAPKSISMNHDMSDTSGQHYTKAASEFATTSRSSSTSPNTTSKPKPTMAIQSEPSFPLSVAQDLFISICDSGHYMACASKKMFAILRREKNASRLHSPVVNMAKEESLKSSSYEWVLIGQGSGVDTPLDAITTILCLPLYVPRSNQRLQNGHLVVIQQLHHTPVVSIKARIGAGKIPGEDEDEMTILHEGGKVVCIEGESLWVVLRLSNGFSHIPDSVQASQAPTFAYKKWSLQNQDLLVDVVSCGPARHKPTLSNGYSSSSSSSMYTSQATERFVSVGSKPMIAFYASSSSSRPLLSATSLATQMAARVTNAVFGFAKSIWGSSPSPRSGSPSLGSTNGRATPDQRRMSGQSQNDGASGPFGNIYSSAMAPATEVPAVLWLSDSQRCIRSLSLAPAPPRGSCYHYPSKLAAMTDSLGRVLLVDLEECEIIRMWKGLRGARCGWIQEERAVRSPRVAENDNPNETSLKRHLVLYLVIYAPKRGTVEIYPARQGKRIGLIQVGLGWKICTTFTSPIGKPVLLDKIAGAPKLGLSLESHLGEPTATSPIDDTTLGLSQCLLIGPTGEVRCVKSKLLASSSFTSPASANSPNALPSGPSANITPDAIGESLETS
ncbi:Rab3 GTPase-activating protein non-catalytic subunit [Haplosporangium sp. Z 27]|nr:Rab3 GTPase-activating protein non-catalytic subunit [Haplosporangium sp. Z 27]